MRLSLLLLLALAVAVKAAVLKDELDRECLKKLMADKGACPHKKECLKKDFTGVCKHCEKSHHPKYCYFKCESRHCDKPFYECIKHDTEVCKISEACQKDKECRDKPKHRKCMDDHFHTCADKMGCAEKCVKKIAVQALMAAAGLELADDDSHGESSESVDAPQELAHEEVDEELECLRKVAADKDKCKELRGCAAKNQARCEEHCKKHHKHKRTCMARCEVRDCDSKLDECLKKDCHSCKLDKAQCHDPNALAKDIKCLENHGHKCFRYLKCGEHCDKVKPPIDDDSGESEERLSDHSAESGESLDQTSDHSAESGESLDQNDHSEESGESLDFQVDPDEQDAEDRLAQSLNIVSDEFDRECLKKLAGDKDKCPTFRTCAEQHTKRCEEHCHGHHNPRLCMFRCEGRECDKPLADCFDNDCKECGLDKERCKSAHKIEKHKKCLEDHSHHCFRFLKCAKECVKNEKMEAEMFADAEAAATPETVVGFNPAWIVAAVILTSLMAYVTVEKCRKKREEGYTRLATTVDQSYSTF